MEGDVERKVIRIFRDSETESVKAILYREEDHLCLTLGYMLQYVFSGKRIYHSDPDELCRYGKTA